MIKLSNLVGMEVYTDAAQLVGKVYDVILDMQKGEVVRLTLEPLNPLSKDEAKRIFKDKTIMYRSVKAVEKIIIVSSVGAKTTDFYEQEQPKDAPSKARPPVFSYRYKK